MSKGLTIIESLIGLTVVSFGVFFIILVFPLSFHYSQTSEKNSIGLFLASAKMEEMIALNYSQLEEGSVIDNFENYRREVSVSCFHPERDCSNEETGIKKIKVDVSVDTDHENSISLTTLVTDR